MTKKNQHQPLSATSGQPATTQGGNASILTDHLSKQPMLLKKPSKKLPWKKKSLTMNWKIYFMTIRYYWTMILINILITSVEQLVMIQNWEQHHITVFHLVCFLSVFQASLKISPGHRKSCDFKNVFRSSYDVFFPSLHMFPIKNGGNMASWKIL